MPIETANSSAEHRELTHRELTRGIFFLSFGMLLLEITLTRIFSFAISYHFAYLTIATAMLGFGSAGSFLAGFPDMFGSARNRIVAATTAAGISGAAALAVSAFLRFNPQSLSSSPTALATLAVYYIVVAIPFLSGGIAIATILASRPEKVSQLYAWDLLGAGLGCGAAVPLIWWAGTPLAVVTALGAIATSPLFFVGDAKSLRRRAGAGMVATAVIGLLAALAGPFPPSPGKFLHLFVNSPGAEHLFARWTPLSRVDAVGWERSRDSWRGSYATSGVSETFTGRGPEYRMVGYDGGSFAVMYEWSGEQLEGEELDFLRRHIMAAPYEVLEDPDLLIIGFGGGADALGALANGVGDITALELNPITVELGAERFADFNGGLFNREGVHVVAAEARHWIESHDQKFDLVVLNSIDTLSALSTGAYVLAESYLYTAEAFQSYLERLAPGGMYALFSFDNNGIAAPTFIVQRFASTLRTALLGLGVQSPEKNIVIIASRDDIPFVATLVRLEPFEQADIDRLVSFADRMKFDVWHRPDVAKASGVSGFLSADDSARERLIDEHYLRFDPATDASPFFFNFYKWRSLVRAHPDDPGGTPATGQRMLLIMLIQAVLVAAFMTFWPLTRLRRRASVSKPIGFIVYFAALGLGFILLEIALLQRFVLFLGFPTYSLSVVLFALLVSTGLGSALSGRLSAPFAPKALPAALALAVATIVFIVASPSLFAVLLVQPLWVRVAVTVAVLAPLGLILGMFFPIGIRTVEAIDPRLVPWAWAINGCTTVVGTIAAVMLAMALGFDTVMLIAVAIYITGALALRRFAS